jgi:RND family efflux transporter MFP subunit
MKIIIATVFVFLCVTMTAHAEESCHEFEGLIEPSEQVELASQVPGVVAEVLVDRGDFVRKGQVVARLSSTVEQAAIDLSKARVEFGKRKMVRNEELFLEQLISTSEKDELATEVLLAELELRGAEERLKLRTVRSPIDGIVVERLLSPGEYINEGAIMHIAAINPLNVELVVPVECVGSIAVKAKATVLLEEPVGGSYPCQVVIVDKVIDAASGTYGVRLALENPKGKLPAGLKCRVQFEQ